MINIFNQNSKILSDTRITFLIKYFYQKLNFKVFFVSALWAGLIDQIGLFLEKHYLIKYFNQRLELLSLFVLNYMTRYFKQISKILLLTKYLLPNIFV